MKSFKIFGKLFSSHSAIGLMAILAVSVIFYNVLKDALIERALDQLSSINILKKQLVENHLIRSQQNLEALHVENKLLEIYQSLRDPELSKGRHDIEDIRKLCQLYDFRNLHLFDTHHHQLFSTDADMYPEGLLSKIDSAISENPFKMRIIDASVHSDKNETLLFYYVPVVDDNRILGIVLVQENFQKIQRILLENTGMGNTGESYIVGHDFSLRSKSRFFPDSLPGLIKAETEAVQSLFKGKDGQGILRDYRGVSVLSAYRNISNRDLQWAILSEMDEEEAMKPILRLRNYLIVVTLVLILLIVTITYLISDAIVRPILKLKEVILTLSKGVIPSGNLKIETRDEIGEMAEAIRQLTEGLSRTAVFAGEIGSGNFNTSFTILSERDALGLALLRMRSELKQLQERELKLARARAAALLEGQETERARIIKELHDGVGQMMTAILMQVDSLDVDITRKTEIKRFINEAIAEIRRISYNVMPQALVDFGLEAALKGLCKSVAGYSSITIDFQYVHDTSDKLDFEITIALYRIIQEALTNVVRHSDASHVILHLLDKEEEMYCLIEDNGKGFVMTEANRKGGSGLRNIRERVMLLNGTVEITGRPETGTSIEIHIPKNLRP